MVHVLIIAHSELAYSFLHCIEQIFAKKIDYLHVIGVKSIDDVNSVLNEVQMLTNSLEEVLILTDIFGATPYNIATKLVVKNKIELITGLNLPMLIRAVSYAKSGLLLCKQKTLEGALSGIIHIDNTNDNQEDLSIDC